MKRIGIDPGLSGAIVIIDDDKTPIEWTMMPTMKRFREVG